MDKETLAMEILKELKAQSKRWFIIAIVELVLLVGSNIGWLIFESQYETITDEQTQEAYYNDNTTITQNME